MRDAIKLGLPDDGAGTGAEFGSDACVEFWGVARLAMEARQSHHPLTSSSVQWLCEQKNTRRFGVPNCYRATA